MGVTMGEVSDGAISVSSERLVNPGDNDKRPEGILTHYQVAVKWKVIIAEPKFGQISGITYTEIEP